MKKNSYLVILFLVSDFCLKSFSAEATDNIKTVNPKTNLPIETPKEIKTNNNTWYFSWGYNRDRWEKVIFM